MMNSGNYTCTVKRKKLKVSDTATLEVYSKINIENTKTLLPMRVERTTFVKYF